MGCFGLVDGEAIQIRTGATIDAERAVKQDGPFVCSRCWTPAIVRKDRGGNRAEHFAHHAPRSPILSNGETDAHRQAKNEICEALKEKFPNGKWEVERTIPANKAKQTPALVPDISGRVTDDQRLAIEVQTSTSSLATILKRSKAYHELEIPVLWILPLTKPIDFEFRPRSFERYLHSMYFGRVYYWKRGDGLHVTPTHYVPVERWVDTREWHDAQGDEHSGGGFFRRLRLIRTAASAASVDFTREFMPQRRREFRPDNEKRVVPPLLVWRDKLRAWWNEEDEDAIQRQWNQEDAANPNEHQKRWLAVATRPEKQGVTHRPGKSAIISDTLGERRALSSDWEKAIRTCETCGNTTNLLHKRFRASSGQEVFVCLTCFRNGIRW